MPTPSPEIVQLLTIFAVAFTTPALAKATVLTYGTILAPGRRTVTAALRAMGLANEKEFGSTSSVNPLLSTNIKRINE